MLLFPAPLKPSPRSLGRLASPLPRLPPGFPAVKTALLALSYSLLIRLGKINGLSRAVPTGGSPSQRRAGSSLCSRSPFGKALSAPPLPAGAGAGSRAGCFFGGRAVFAFGGDSPGEGSVLPCEQSCAVRGGCPLARPPLPLSPTLLGAATRFTLNPPFPPEK